MNNIKDDYNDIKVMYFFGVLFLKKFFKFFWILGWYKRMLGSRIEILFYRKEMLFMFEKFIFFLNWKWKICIRIFYYFRDSMLV